MVLRDFSSPAEFSERLLSIQYSSYPQLDRAHEQDSRTLGEMAHAAYLALQQVHGAEEDKRLVINTLARLFSRWHVQRCEREMRKADNERTNTNDDVADCLRANLALGRRHTFDHPGMQYSPWLAWLGYHCLLATRALTEQEEDDEEIRQAREWFGPELSNEEVVCLWLDREEWDLTSEKNVMAYLKAKEDEDRMSEVVAVMLKHLGLGVLPYLEFGNADTVMLNVAMLDVALDSFKKPCYQEGEQFILSALDSGTVDLLTAAGIECSARSAAQA